MNYRISYSSLTRKTSIHQGSTLVFAGRSNKQWFTPIWSICDLHGQKVAAFTLQRKGATTLHVQVLEQTPALTLSLRYHASLLTYSFSFMHEGCCYEIHPHLQDRFSIFKQQVQVASLFRVAVTNFFTSHWILLADNNLNSTLLLAISYGVFILGGKHFDRWGDDPDIYWIKEAVSFDATWLPS